VKQKRSQSNLYMSKVLIVEDDLPTLKIYNEAFTKAGIGVREFTSGDIPIAFMKSVDPDVILLDIMLAGGKNGFDVLEDIKKDPDLKKIPVIMLTNLESEDVIAKKIGADDYLIKANISLDQLVERVKKFLKSKKD